MRHVRVRTSLTPKLPGLGLTLSYEISILSCDILLAQGPAAVMRINGFKVTRFQFARDRTIGDSQISSRFVHAAALELTVDSGLKGLGFVNSIMFPLPSEDEIIRIFEAECWPDLT